MEPAEFMQFNQKAYRNVADSKRFWNQDRAALEMRVYEETIILDQSKMDRRYPAIGEMTSEHGTNRRPEAVPQVRAGRQNANTFLCLCQRS